MSIDDNELRRRRIEAWLELRDSEPNQVKIGKIVRLSQPTVSRAIAIAEGELPGPHTVNMNRAIDRYITSRDLERATRERERQEAEEGAAEEEALREEESRREKLWDWVDGELRSEEQEEILRAYRQHHGLREPLTEDEELAILARHLERRPGRPPPVKITFDLPPPRAVRPADPKPVTQPQEPTRETVATPPQAASPPVRRSASPPRQTPVPPARPRIRAASSPSGIDFQRLAQLVGSVLAVLAVVVGIVMLASTDTARELWTTASETSPYWGPIVLGLASIMCLMIPLKKDEPAKGALWYMRASACVALFISMINIVGLVGGLGDASFVDRYLP